MALTNFFTRKNKPNAKTLAQQRANETLKRNYRFRKGANKSYMANVFKSPGNTRRHTELREEERKRLYENYLKEIEAEIKSTTPAQKNAIIALRDEIKEKMMYLHGGGNSDSNSGGIQITIPGFIANLVVIALNIIILFILVGTGIVSILMTLFGNNAPDTQILASLGMISLFGVSNSVTLPLYNSTRDKKNVEKTS